MPIEPESLAKMLVWTTLPIPEWAYEAADRILDIDAIEMKFKGWNKDGTRKRIASIITAHAEPLVALLRESKREHSDGEDIDCPMANPTFSYNKGEPCTCGADTWNARVEAALTGSKCDGNHGGPRCSDPECWNQ